MSFDRIKCKSKNCLRLLPEGYPHKYCEECRDKRALWMKRAGEAAAGALAVVGLRSLLKRDK